MITVVVTKKDKSILKGFFKDKKSAEEWVFKHKLKGKEEKVITTPTKIKGSQLIEEVDGPMGVILFKQKFEADFKVEYIDNDKESKEYKIQQLREERDNILLSTDWLFVSDADVPTKGRNYYREYRKYLRNITKKADTTNDFSFEKFDHWLRRKYPEEFMDGGDSKNIIKKFNYYIK
jgi:hypothetical protein